MYKSAFCLHTVISVPAPTHQPPFVVVYSFFKHMNHHNTVWWWDHQSWLTFAHHLIVIAGWLCLLFYQWSVHWHRGICCWSNQGSFIQRQCWWRGHLIVVNVKRTTTVVLLNALVHELQFRSSREIESRFQPSHWPDTLNITIRTTLLCCLKSLLYRSMCISCLHLRRTYLSIHTWVCRNCYCVAATKLTQTCNIYVHYRKSPANKLRKSLHARLWLTPAAQSLKISCFFHSAVDCCEENGKDKRVGKRSVGVVSRFSLPSWNPLGIRPRSRPGCLKCKKVNPSPTWSLSVRTKSRSRLTR